MYYNQHTINKHFIQADHRRPAAAGQEVAIPAHPGRPIMI